MRGSRALAFTLSVLIAVVGCRTGMVIVDESFQADLVSAAHAGRTVSLHELTHFDWETVYIFQDEWSGKDINRGVGERVMGDDDFQDEHITLWVFKHDGRVVRAVQTGGYVVIGVPNPVVALTNVLLVPTSSGSQLTIAGGSPIP